MDVPWRCEEDQMVEQLTKWADIENGALQDDHAMDMLPRMLCVCFAIVIVGTCSTVVE
jgi:hypothetical protein